MSRTTRPRRNAVAAAALVSVLALTATACGDEGKDDTGKGKDDKGSTVTTPEKPKDPFAGKTDAQIMESALAATKAAKSLTIKGEGPMDAEPGKPKQRADINLSIHNDGRCVGTMGVKGEGKVEIANVGSAAYIRPDDTFMRTQINDPSMSAGEQEQVIKMMSGKWLTGDKNSDFAGFAEICDLKKIMDEDGENSTEDNVKPADARRAGEATVNGQKALKLTGKNGTEAYVATEGEPVLLKLVGKDSGEQFTLHLSEYNKAPLPKIPNQADVLDMSQMG
ncbi:hypothetical protein ABZ714_16195 [Streptomyces sp. NPDC006798]|uniref:hypothetical protein n=1 Tax=Streptomyces sp. NPDC006798 TaxID=3155462 RepID=UPI0033C73059